MKTERSGSDFERSEIVCTPLFGVPTERNTV